MNQSNTDPILFYYLFSMNEEYQSSKKKNNKNKIKLTKNEQINNMLSKLFIYTLLDLIIMICL
jgi:hypothetical protein